MQPQLSRNLTKCPANGCRLPAKKLESRKYTSAFHPHMFTTTQSKVICATMLNMIQPVNGIWRTIVGRKA